MRDWLTNRPWIVKRSWPRSGLDFWGAGRQVRPPRVIVLHTTETTGFPGYGGGASNPHFTVSLTSGRVEQHVPLSYGSRALRISADRKANVDGVIQVEIIGAVDPTYPAKHGHYDIPNEFPRDAKAQAYLARLIAAIVAETGIHVAESVDWIKYPASYGENARQRLSLAAWRDYRGLIGHQHVPGNSHGDPGALPVATVLIPAVRALLNNDEPEPPKEAPVTLIDQLETELRGRGFQINCGPSHHRSGRCNKRDHGHGKGSAHWDGTGLDIGFDPKGGPGISRWEQAHLDALVREIRSRYGTQLRGIWNRGPGDHQDHAHFDLQLHNGWQVKYAGVTGITLDPRAFPNLSRPTPKPSTTLRKGDRGQAVKEWQADLRTIGYRIVADGVFGNDTDRDTKAFQKAHKLDVDGVVGPASRAAMAKALKPKPAPKPPTKPKPKPKPAPVVKRGSRGPTVKALQTGLLNVFPSYAGPIGRTGGADGVYGKGTEDVVIEFQKRAGLTADGVVGAKTWAALAKHGITP